MAARRPAVPEKQTQAAIARYLVRQQGMKQNMNEAGIQWCLADLEKTLPFPLVVHSSDMIASTEEWFRTWYAYHITAMVGTEAVWPRVATLKESPGDT